MNKYILTLLLLTLTLTACSDVVTRQLFEKAAEVCIEKGGLAELYNPTRWLPTQENTGTAVCENGARFQLKTKAQP